MSVLVRLVLVGLVAVTLSAFESVPAKAETIISSLSSGLIEIASNFDGSQIVVFGSIERTGLTAGRGQYDIIVTVTGPPETTVTRRKDRVLGFWINQNSRQFDNLPSYYYVLSTRPIEDVTTEQMASRFMLGFNQLPVQGARTANAPAEDQRFVDALLRLKQEENLYRYESDGVTFLSPRLFRATIDLPSNVPVGAYQVEVRLFSDNAVLATDTKPFLISKVGFERAMYAVSQDRPLFYGIATVAIALLTGWLAGLMFRRD